MATKTKPKIETLYTIEEVCEILKVDGCSLRRWIKAGDVRAININPNKKGKAIIRIQQSTLDNMLGGDATANDATPERSRRRQTDKAKRKRLLTTNNYL